MTPHVVVLMTYEMSRKLTNGVWAQLALSGAIGVGIVVIVQLLPVGVLLIMAFASHLSCEERIEETA